ncbi:MAG: hypothetical protein C0505_10320 [Leptothrix sp. (in: Bacteria)]|nr:hypothetical protein [Leptothrix sp. (in: b-proteobacteria)]
MLAPVSAVIVTTNYDPDFGAGPLNGYGWRATINFEIPITCFDTAGFKVNLFGVVLGCGAPQVADFKVLSAQAGFYQSGSPGTLLDVLTFDPNTLPLGAVEVVPPVTLAYVVALTPSNEVRGQAAFDDDILFRLRLFGPTAELQYRVCPTGVSPCPDWTTAPSPTETTFVRQDGKTFEQVFAQTELRVGAVPEPGSAGLALLALGAGLAATRRR